MLKEFYKHCQCSVTCLNKTATLASKHCLLFSLSFIVEVVNNRAGDLIVSAPPRAYEQIHLIYLSRRALPLKLYALNKLRDELKFRRFSNNRVGTPLTLCTELLIRNTPRRS